MHDNFNEANWIAVTCVPAMLEAGIVLAVSRVCLSAQNLKIYWSEIDVTW